MLEKMLHHKLLKEGEQGKAVVTKRKDQATDSSAGMVYSTFFELEGHMRLPDGSEIEFRSEMLSSHKVGDIEAGAIVPVRYDAEDPKKCVLDVVALEAAKAKRKADAEAYFEHRDQENVAAAEARLAAENQQHGGRHHR
jgi:hypothetical protein